MSIAEKFEVIADAVYEAGKDAMWDIVQHKGARKDYGYFAYMWDADYVRPKYKVIPTADTTGVNTFGKAKIKGIESKYFDFSQKPRGTSNNQSWYYTYSNCTELEEIPDIGMQADFAYAYTYAYCYKLKKIEVIRTDEDTTWSNTFNGDEKLEDITIEGTIGKSGFNIRWSTKLSGESIVSIIEALSSTTSGLSVTLSQTAVNKMVFPIVGKKGTYNSWTELEQSKTNWTISLL